MKIDALLLAWYDKNARTLPWRGERDPYKIWLSEIMLQQTRTETVKGYYDRFLNRFPTVRSLADAELDEVLKLWEGLGYYSRARNLHACAKQVAAAGGFPRTVEGLLRLKGVGPYAARAVGSIAFGLCEPALDGNQMRVLSRCLSVDRVLKTPFDLLDEARELISRERPGDYNQALMDLGASVCTAAKPKCDACPLSKVCLAHSEGDPERYPMRPAPIVKREENHTIVLIFAQGGVCVQRRPERGLLGGLYEFACFDGHLTAEACAAAIGASERDIRPLPCAKHVFTHLVWHMIGYTVSAQSAPDGMRIVSAEEFCGLAFPSALRVYVECARDALKKSL